MQPRVNPQLPLVAASVRTFAHVALACMCTQRPYGSNNQYAYNNWSPPAQSNETSNGYFLERSHSARMTLAKAVELCPEEVRDGHTVVTQMVTQT